MEEDELAEIQRCIREAEADLKRAEERENEVLQLKYAKLNFLLEIQKRLTAGMAKRIMFNLEDRTNCL